MPPLLRRTGGRIEEVGTSAGGLPLGIDPDYEYSAVQFSLDVGESLVFYTDGVLDATNRDGKRYEIGRLRAMLTKGTNLASVRPEMSCCSSFCDAITRRGHLGEVDAEIVVGKGGSLERCFADDVTELRRTSGEQLLSVREEEVEVSTGLHRQSA